MNPPPIATPARHELDPDCEHGYFRVVGADGRCVVTGCSQPEALQLVEALNLYANVCQRFAAYAVSDLGVDPETADAAFVRALPAAEKLAQAMRLVFAPLGALDPAFVRVVALTNELDLRTATDDGAGFTPDSGYIYDVAHWRFAGLRALGLDLVPATALHPLECIGCCRELRPGDLFAPVFLCASCHLHGRKVRTPNGVRVVDYVESGGGVWTENGERFEPSQVGPVKEGAP